MANFTKNWISSRVDGDSNTMNEVDDFINELYTAISERISDFIYGFATDNSEIDDTAKGFFKLPLKEQASDPSNESDKGILYAKDVSGVTELFYEDSDGNVKQLTTGGKLNVASDEAVLLSGNQTINGVKTFGSIPVLPTSDPTSDNEAVRKAYIKTTPTANKPLALDGNAKFPASTGLLGNNIAYHFTFDDGSLTINTSWTTLLSLNFTSSVNEVVLIWAKAVVYGGDTHCIARVKVDGTGYDVSRARYYCQNNTAYKGTVSPQYVISLSAGSHTITFEAYGSPSSLTCEGGRTLTILRIAI